jgi:hypothetical protein
MGKSTSPSAKIQPAIKPYRDAIRPRMSISMKRPSTVKYCHVQQANRGRRNFNDTVSIGELIVFHSRDAEKCPGDIERSAKASDSPLLPRPRPRLVSFENVESIGIPLSPFASTRPDIWKRISMKPRPLLTSVCHSLVGVDLLQDLDAEAYSSKSLPLCAGTAIVQKSEENGFVTPKNGLEEYPSLPPRDSKSSSEEDCLLWLPLSMTSRLLLPDDFWEMSLVGRLPLEYCSFEGVMKVCFFYILKEKLEALYFVHFSPRDDSKDWMS